MTSYKTIRCRFFDDDGNPKKPYCSKGRSCGFLHPNEPKWKAGLRNPVKLDKDGFVIEPRRYPRSSDDFSQNRSTPFSQLDFYKRESDGGPGRSHEHTPGRRHEHESHSRSRFDAPLGKHSDSMNDSHSSRRESLDIRGAASQSTSHEHPRKPFHHHHPISATAALSKSASDPSIGSPSSLRAPEATKSLAARLSLNEIPSSPPKSTTPNNLPIAFQPQQPQPQTQPQSQSQPQPQPQPQPQSQPQLQPSTPARDQIPVPPHAPSPAATIGPRPESPAVLPSAVLNAITNAQFTMAPISSIASNSFPMPSLKKNDTEKLTPLFRRMARLSNDLAEDMRLFQEEEKKMEKYNALSSTLSKISTAGTAPVANTLSDIIAKHSEFKERIDKDLKALGLVSEEVFEVFACAVDDALQNSLQRTIDQIKAEEEASLKAIADAKAASLASLFSTFSTLSNSAGTLAAERPLYSINQPNGYLPYNTIPDPLSGVGALRHSWYNSFGPPPRSHEMERLYDLWKDQISPNNLVSSRIDPSVSAPGQEPSAEYLRKRRRSLSPQDRSDLDEPRSKQMRGSGQSPEDQNMMDVIGNIQAQMAQQAQQLQELFKENTQLKYPGRNHTLSSSTGSSKGFSVGNSAQDAHSLSYQTPIRHEDKALDLSSNQHTSDGGEK